VAIVLRPLGGVPILPGQRKFVYPMFNSITNAQDGFHRHHNAKPLVMRSTRIFFATNFHYKKHLSSVAPHLSLFGRRTKCRRSWHLSFMPLRISVWLMIKFCINSPIGKLTSILTMPFFTCTLFAYQIAYSQVSHICIFFSTVCVIKWTNFGAISRQRQLIPFLHPKCPYLTKPLHFRNIAGGRYSTKKM